MMKPLAVIAMLAFTANTVSAEGLRESAHTAATAVAAQHPDHRGPMPPGLKWTGIGLLIGGGVTVLLGAAVKNDDSCGYSVSSDDCEALGTGFYVFGAALAGTGAVLLGVANAKREHLPYITVQRGRVSVRQRFSF